MELQTACEADLDEVRRVARESLSASYGSFLDDDLIATAVSQWYPDDRADELVGDVRAPLLVAIDGDSIVGFSQSALVETETTAGDNTTVGEIRWLHVDPDARDSGVGDALLDQTQAALKESGATRILGFVLEGNADGTHFYEQHGFDRLDTRRIDIGEEHYTEHVYLATLDDTDSVDWHVTETVDGETYHLALDEAEIGSQTPFYAAYRDPARDTLYGWYCSNCDTIDVAVDSMGRLVCNRCGNAHQATRWDSAYL